MTPPGARGGARLGGLSPLGCGATDARVGARVTNRSLRGYITNMAADRHVKLATRVLVGAGVLCLATGAASASNPDARSPISAEIQRLQETWGTNVVRTAQVIPGSHTLLVGTRDQSLLRSAAPKRWLGAKYQIVVIFVRPPGSTHTTIDNKCASTTDIPMMEDFRDST